MSYGDAGGFGWALPAESAGGGRPRGDRRYPAPMLRLIRLGDCSLRSSWLRRWLRTQPTSRLRPPLMGGWPETNCRCRERLRRQNQGGFCSPRRDDRPGLCACWPAGQRVNSPHATFAVAGGRGGGGGGGSDDPAGQCLADHRRADEPHVARVPAAAAATGHRPDRAGADGAFARASHRGSSAACWPACTSAIRSRTWCGS